MIQVLDKEIKWENGKKISIPYIDYDNVQKNYFPDYIIGNQIVEIKPKKLSYKEIKKFVDRGDVLFTERYLTKWSTYADI